MKTAPWGRPAGRGPLGQTESKPGMAGNLASGTGAAMLRFMVSAVLVVVAVVWLWGCLAPQAPVVGRVLRRSSFTDWGRAP